MAEQLGAVDEALAIGDLFRAGDLLALPLLERADELGRLQQRCSVPVSSQA